VPIVILTSTEAQEKEIAVHQLGKVEVVRKPLNGIAFGEAIQRLGIR
jgi:DNA-binding response OmpR family regulator